MNRKISFYISFAAILLGFAGCNSSYEDEYLEDTTVSNVMVTEFSLEKNDKILVNLDSVFFSIDLDESRIYNADSLPKGTVLGKVPVKITLPSVSVAEIRVPGVSTSDSLVNYLEDSSDSIDFSHGPVALKVVALDGVTTRNYTIQINVHKMEPDSLYWNKLAMRTLPDVYSSPSRQKTVEWNGEFYCMIGSLTECKLVKSATPDFASYSEVSGVIPSNADVNTLTVGGKSLYLLDGDNNLYEYASGEWSMTGSKMSHIYGYYIDHLLGVRQTEDAYYHVTYPATDEYKVAEDCPVEGTSIAITYDTPWADNPLLMVVGGVTASGVKVGCSWAYDGTQWANVTIVPMAPRSDMTVFAYYTYYTSTNWAVTQYPTLFALGGVDASGKADNTVYVSRDQGVHWTKGDELVQLPNYIVPMYGAQALVVNTTMSVSRSTMGWNEYPALHLPMWWQIEPYAVQSRMSVLPDEWECPYVYLYGGYHANGLLSNTIWRGVINRLSFRPLL